MQLQCSVYPPLQRLTAELQQSSSERARMLVEADDLRHRVEQQGRRLKEAEAEKAALEAQLGSSTGQLRHAREKATETIKRCVHMYVRTYVCMYIVGARTQARYTYMLDSSRLYCASICRYICVYVGPLTFQCARISCHLHVVAYTCMHVLYSLRTV